MPVAHCGLGLKTVYEIAGSNIFIEVTNSPSVYLILFLLSSCEVQQEYYCVVQGLLRIN
jgi:hypothetical protein